MNYSNIQKIDELKEAPNVGTYYLVPVYKALIRGNLYKVPLINCLHTDKENGQFEPHYHVDTRFLRKIKEWFFKRVYPHEYSDFKIEYIYLKCYHKEVSNITSPTLISKSKIKHKCIHKGKCPHRGMDLSQVVPINGVIRCPLHGLEFDEQTKQLIEL